MKTRDALGLLAWTCITLCAGAVGAAGSLSARQFYGSLERPGWAPPGWLFGPVWTALYLTMAVSAWLIWKARERSNVWHGLKLFLVQLAANALWSWLFFAWRQGAWAFAEIIVLWILIVATIIAFARVSRLAAGLLVPYLAWVTFAACLCWAVWQLNPGALR